MDAETRLKIEERIIAMLKTVYDPEIPVNIYDLGLIYKIDLQDDGDVSIDMTLTAPNCPAADFIMEDVRQKVDSVEGVNSSVINLVFEPEWDKDLSSSSASSLRWPVNSSKIAFPSLMGAESTFFRYSSTVLRSNS